MGIYVVCLTQLCQGVFRSTSIVSHVYLHLFGFFFIIHWGLTFLIILNAKISHYLYSIKRQLQNPLRRDFCTELGTVSSLWMTSYLHPLNSCWLSLLCLLSFYLTLTEIQLQYHPLYMQMTKSYSVNELAVLCPGIGLRRKLCYTRWKKPIKLMFGNK